MLEAIEILTKMKIEAHFEKELNKEAKIDLAIKTLKLVLQYEWLSKTFTKIQRT